MLALYLFTFVFGSIVLGASLLLGGEADADADVDFDADLDADLDLDVDADVDLDADLDADVDADIDAGLDQEFADAGTTTGGADASSFSLFLFIRPRFLLFASTFFGLTGLLSLTFEAVFGWSMPGLALAIPMGFFAGWAATVIVDRLKREDTGRVASARSYVGMTGQVLLPVRPDKRGIVHLTIQGQGVDMAARSHSGDTFERGDTVVVVKVADAVLLVSRATS